MKIRTIRRTAITATLAGAALAYAAGPAAANVVYVVSGNDLGVAAVNGSDTVTIACSGGQTQLNGISQLPCAALEQLDISTDGNDAVKLGLLDPATFPHLTTPHIDTSNGLQDSVVGSQVADVVTADSTDTVTGNGGDDHIVGASTVDGGTGNDRIEYAIVTVDAGPGDDTIVNPGGAVDGGAGHDTVVLDWPSLDGDVGYAMTLDASGYAVHEDGGLSTGITTTGIEAYDITFGPANQRLDWHGYAGPVSLHAGGGDDVLTAGTGHDVVDAGDGNDTVDVRDGQADTVDCGPGTDTVLADSHDTLTGCEHVTRTAPETGGVAGPRKVRHGHRATYRFSADTPGATYRCRIDHKAYRACPATYVLRTRKLAIGRHRLQVVAVVDGVADATPTVKKIRVVH